MKVYVLPWGKARLLYLCQVSKRTYAQRVTKIKLRAAP